MTEVSSTVWSGRNFAIDANAIETGLPTEFVLEPLTAILGVVLPVFVVFKLTKHVTVPVVAQAVVPPCAVAVPLPSPVEPR